MLTVDWYGGCIDLYTFERGDKMAVRYRSEILEPIVRPFAGAVGDDLILMPDYTCPHTARVPIILLEDESISVMHWPARSPNLNPIKPGTCALEAKNILQIMFRGLPIPRDRSSRACHVGSV